MKFARSRRILERLSAQGPRHLLNGLAGFLNAVHGCLKFERNLWPRSPAGMARHGPAWPLSLDALSEAASNAAADRREHPAKPRHDLAPEVWRRRCETCDILRSRHFISRKSMDEIFAITFVTSSSLSPYPVLLRCCDAAKSRCCASDPWPSGGATPLGRCLGWNGYPYQYSPCTKQGSVLEIQSP